MNQNKNNLKNNHNKNYHSNPVELSYDTCEQCSNMECNCSCHFHKIINQNIHEDINFHFKMLNIGNMKIEELADANG